MSETLHTWWTTDVPCPDCGEKLNWCGKDFCYCEGCDKSFDKDPYELKDE